VFSEKGHGKHIFCWYWWCWSIPWVII